jgi:hypothetical protein
MPLNILTIAPFDSSVSKGRAVPVEIVMSRGVSRLLFDHTYFSVDIDPINHRYGPPIGAACASKCPAGKASDLNFSIQPAFQSNH